MKSVTASGIARVAQEATRAYASVLGHSCFLDGQTASPQQHQSALVGVQAVLSGEARSGAQLHAVWLGSPDGGLASAVAAPSYEQLPLAERRRILLFRAVVLALVDGPCSGYCHDEKCPIMNDHDCHLDVCVSRFGIPPGLWQTAFEDGGGGGAGISTLCPDVYC